MIECTDNYFNKINGKYNLVGNFSMLEIVKDFSILSDFLSKGKDVYSPCDRILIKHFDTDFYLADTNIGINMYNLIEAFIKTRTPLFTLLLVTNHFGIKREIEHKLRNHNKNDFPTIIETFISMVNYPSTFTTDDSRDITRPAICMMKGSIRSHRLALFNELKNKKLLGKVSASIRGRKKRHT
jgi:hypothetical protein